MSIEEWQDKKEKELTDRFSDKLFVKLSVLLDELISKQKSMIDKQIDKREKFMEKSFVLEFRKPSWFVSIWFF